MGDGITISFPSNKLETLSRQLGQCLATAWVGFSLVWAMALLPALKLKTFHFIWLLLSHSPTLSLSPFAPSGGMRSLGVAP